MRRRKRKSRIIRALRESPINFFSDLFIIAMTTIWIADIIYEAAIATAVTASSIVLSFQTQTPCYDTSMWSAIGTSAAVPLTAGGALWMIKCGVQHAIANKKGKTCKADFPSVPVETDDSEKEEEAEG